MITTSTTRPLTIVVLARLQPESSGGIAQAVIGTVAGLGALTDGDEQFVIVTDPSAPDWLDSYAGPNTRIVTASEPSWLTQSRQWRARIRPMIKPLLPIVDLAYRGAHCLRSRGALSVDLSPYDPCVEALEPDVVHFPYQWMHRTTAPAIFNPQDVQHVHHPEFFADRVILMRKHMYPLWCSVSTLVEVPSQATKKDLITHLGVSSEKIVVVPKGAPTTLAQPVEAQHLTTVRITYSLPDRFLFFPAQTWPHKNHARLFDALALLRDEQGIRLSLVCTGYQNEHWPDLRVKIDELQLDRQVQFLGFIPPIHVRALYHLAQFTVFPTLFEGGGFPLLEAFSEGSPLACSNIPVLAEQADGAALLFDPMSSRDIARALLELHQNNELRGQLRARGTTRLRHYSWDRTARTYRALYRKLANYPLSEEDVSLLEPAFGGVIPGVAQDRRREPGMDQHGELLYEDACALPGAGW